MHRHVQVEGLRRDLREGLAQIEPGGVDEDVDGQPPLRADRGDRRPAVGRYEIGGDPQLVTEQALTLAGGRAGCATLLELDDRPTALIGGIDLFAIGCMEEVHSRGIAIPGGLSVIGIDGLDMSAHVSPSLATVHLPIARIGQVAAETLMAAVAGRAFEQRVELPMELIVRRSTAARR